jgi:zinc protease
MRALTLPALLLAGSLLPAPARGQAQDWREIVKPPLKPFAPVAPRRVVLGNGLVLLLQEDHELPLVRGLLRIRGGSREEPAAQAGLVSILGEAWRTGGTRSRSGDALDDFLEARAAKVETSGGLDSTTLGFDCLKQDFDAVLGVVRELLLEPAFQEEKIALARAQLETEIARRNDDPSGLAAREARKLGYGADSPLARVPEYATVAAVAREQLLGWHRDFVHPNNAVLGMLGDFDARAMQKRLEQALGGWKRGPAARQAALAFRDAQPGVYFVAKDDVNQSNIRMVHLGVRKDNPDYHAIEVMNEIFGGGFSARLFSNLRSKKGLAYSVGGGVGTGWDAPGLFQVAMATKSSSTAAAIEALYEEIDSLHRNPASAEELRRAKDAILNSFVFRFDSREKVLRERMLYEFYGYPADFLERYRAGIERVGAEDVARVAKAYVKEQKLALLVVGRAADFDKPLESFGPVTPIEVEIRGEPAGR